MCVHFRCTINLSLLSKEHTHKLDLPLEEGEGVLVLLVTLTASAAVSISDLSVNMLDDPQERHQIMQRYVSYYWLVCESLREDYVCEYFSEESTECVKAHLKSPLHKNYLFVAFKSVMSAQHYCVQLNC